METTAPFERPQNWSELFAFAKRAGEAFIGRTHQWVAGERMEDALLAAKQTNARGMEAILNYLGERLQDRAQVEATAREYLRLLAAMESEGIRGAVSLKPTQFGLLIDRAFALSQVLPVLDAARAQGRVLWLDMEAADTTEDTIWLCERLLERHERVGICLQATLRRTREDVDRLIGAGARIRLVKGAYKEPPDIAHGSRSEIDTAYLKHLETLFARGRDFSVASHDRRMIQRSLELARDRPAPFDFAMLQGVLDPLHAELVQKGQRVSEYISYGPKWLPYFGRRWRDRPRNVVTMARSFVSR
ncbi:MAG: proline dehydrogenase [Methanobacteriota archaeon]|nr:MAG: proline dehydrogenase [Euryarchaeota archaeon]